MTVPVRYLLDANVLSEMMLPAPHPKVVSRIDKVAGQGIALASITVWEIFNGIGLLPSGRRRDQVEAQFRGLLAEYFVDRLLDWNAEDAAACARIMEAKRRLGEPLDAHLPDAMLAGLAVNRRLAVLTRNVKDFRNTGAEIVDPWR